jgi:hypothetical protein
MTGTSSDMTGPRPIANSPVYAVFGIIDPTARTIAELLGAGLRLRQIPLDVIVELDCGIINLKASALDRIRRLDDSPLLGAVGFDDWWTDALTALNPGFPLSTARRLVTDKGLLYSRLANHGVQAPGTIQYLLSSNLIERALEELGPRPILKPATGAGSRGVYRYREDLRAEDNLLLYRRLLAVGHIDSTIEIMATEYLGGAHALEVSVDVITAEGQVTHQIVHEKLTATDAHPFVDRVMVSPPMNPAITAAGGRLHSTVTATIKAIGLTDGTAHLELRLHDDQWYVLDVGIRPGSGLVAHSVQARAGIDPRAVHLLASIGQPMPANHLQGAAGEHEATCIACCYIAPDARDAATFSDHQAMADILTRTPTVFGWHLNAACSDDQVYRPDAGLSVGVGAGDASTALAQLQTLVKTHHFSTA